MSEEILGKYRIVREIGRSNDVVYEALDITINRRIALKELLLPPNLNAVQRRERVERFYREARAAGSLSHPNIVTIYEAGEFNGRHFIAMEYLEGQSLRTILDIEGTLPPERVVEIAKQVCDALAYAHSKGVIHRDIKPDNIHVLPGGRSIKITDFGIARIMEEPGITADGQVFGTPSYMSPEQIAGKPLDARTDIFSLGVMLYEMLTGRKPFTGDTVVTITYNIMNQDVAYPPTIPMHFERVLRRCLAKDPNLRYPSAADVAADLDPNGFAYASPFNQNSSATATVSTSIPTWGPSTPPTSYPPSTSVPPVSQPPSVPDPFGHVKRRRPGLFGWRIRPVITPEAKYFLKVMLTVVAVCVLVIGLIWLLSTGYQGWLEAGRSQEFSSHMEAGRQHFESQNYRAAIEEFNKALSLTRDPRTIKLIRENIAVCYTSLGYAAEQAGDPGQALVLYRQAITTAEDYPNSYVYMGNLLRAMGKEDEALAAWAKAIQVGRGSQAAFAATQSIAILYIERGDRAYLQGNISAALDWWRKAVNVAPGTREATIAQQRIDRVTHG
ncbi:MAG: protein kinase [Armatimonadetes bacterium]|nr:protein kinase [Armatimonadota bacterium]